MRTLMNDSQRNLTVVENDELRRYELLVAGTTVGTLDFRVLGPACPGAYRGHCGSAWPRTRPRP